MGFLYAIPGTDKKKIIKVSVNKMQVAFEVDTGACCTVMSQVQFQRMFGTQKMKFRQNLKTVTGQTVVVRGKLQVHVKVQNHAFNLYLVVIDSEEFTPLMGRDWINVIFPEWRNVFDHIEPTDNVLSNVDGKNYEEQSKKV